MANTLAYFVPPKGKRKLFYNIDTSATTDNNIERQAYIELSFVSLYR
jgi:hypothetical protein